jgi:8-oxo-dGTP pyrophosphatase MutT (NUDIX family)
MKFIKKYNQFILEKIYWGKIGAGILPICIKTGRFLVGLRSDDVMEPNTWGIFGGKLDIDEGINETIKIAALRELEEETKFKGDIELIEGYVFKDENFSYHNFFGIVQYEFEPILNWENDDAIWINYDELMNLNNKHFGLEAFLNDIDSKEKLIDILKKGSF